LISQVIPSLLRIKGNDVITEDHCPSSLSIHRVCITDFMESEYTF
jgi:hypothetical protein